MRANYEARLQQLESRLKKAEADAAAVQSAPQAITPSGAPPPTAVAAESARTSSSASAFNPAISLILSGLYANLSQDPLNYRISGFVPSGEIGPGKRGFSLDETELSFSASVDPWCYGQSRPQCSPTTRSRSKKRSCRPPRSVNGFTLKAGRFLSSIGYLNAARHTWDFVNQPLAYQALLGGQFADDGLQLKLAGADRHLLGVRRRSRPRPELPGLRHVTNGAGAGRYTATPAATSATATAGAPACRTRRSARRPQL